MMSTFTVGSARFLISHRKLLWRVTLNELHARYAGSLLGIGWIVLSPLIILCIYWVVYLMIFRVRVTGMTSMTYVLYIFSGLVPYLMTAEALATGVRSVTTNKSVLSNTVFPIDIAPAKTILSSQGTMVIGLAVIIGGMVMMRQITFAIFLLQIIWMLHLMALMGIIWILSLLNLVFKDLQNLITAILMMMLVLSPIAYTPDMVPPSLKVVLLINPFASLVIVYQKVLVLGKFPNLFEGAILVTLSLGLFFMGSWFFERTKKVLIDYV